MEKLLQPLCGAVQTKYLNENKGGNSTFTIPVSGFDCDIAVVGDTVAMSTPHEIEYTLNFKLVK